MDNEFDPDPNNTVHNCILSRLKLLGIVGAESYLEHVSQGRFTDPVRRGGKNVDVVLDECQRECRSSVGYGDVE